MTARWLDLVDPTLEEILTALPVHADPEIVEILSAPAPEDREPRPLIEGHGAYVFAVLVAMQPKVDRVLFQEIDVVATPELVVTVRKTPTGGTAYDPGALVSAIEEDEPAGILLHRLVDDVADSYLDLLDSIYAEIDHLEEQIDELRPAEVRVRLSELRNELLHRRRTVSATRASVRRVLDGRVDVGGDHALFPETVERLFSDTYDTLVRVTEELDVARDLLSGVRDHLQAKVAENQNEVGKKLTVIASLVLVPSFIVGFYGQNFAGEFTREFWTLGVSTGLILLSTIVQLALFRWRHWI